MQQMEECLEVWSHYWKKNYWQLISQRKHWPLYCIRLNTFCLWVIILFLLSEANLRTSRGSIQECLLFKTVYPLYCELMESCLCMLRNFFSPPWANLLPFCWSRLFSCFGTSRPVWTGGADRPDCPQSVPQAARVPANKPRKRRNVPAQAFTVIKGRLDWNCATCENTKKKSMLQRVLVYR